MKPERKQKDQFCPDCGQILYSEAFLPEDDLLCVTCNKTFSADVTSSEPEQA